jgi:N-acetylneuraminic acid mutarotase
VTGGKSGLNTLGGAELYNVTDGTWSPTGSLTTARSGHTAVLLPDGQVLVAGGLNASGQSLVSAEVYDFTTRMWTPVGPMGTARTGHTATLLANGLVLVTGGNDGSGSFTSFDTAELYKVRISCLSLF